MIKYSLVCDKSHDFESWFPSSDAYDKQVKRGLVECPQCGSLKVSKALMAPSVSTSKRRARNSFIEHAPPLAVAEAPAAPQPMTLLDEQQMQVRAAIRELHQKIAENTVDVGKAFTAEARKMHEGDVPQRAIRGEATFAEAQELWEEGIPVLPVPGLPDDRN
ncbi:MULTISPECIES: DUF1178 family protein [unclassified Beijerinckia]|uniref:DUF1178 family protein n=1 Tax=unclassified Beijerinckia TaxID=2638183 RepID=UPI0008966C4B|nr:MULTISPECIES: DUF1178 family protein [unclassified Beijerinckia]MDH7798434.1 hypothetical protein [Beijerinckia sp. GAS462]SED20748.1 hypothetical protein SAMN05443249_4732 [Beijerinckia sp. 28-YEA-48]